MKAALGQARRGITIVNRRNGRVAGVYVGRPAVLGIRMASGPTAHGPTSWTNTARGCASSTGTTGLCGARCASSPCGTSRMARSR